MTVLVGGQRISVLPLLMVLLFGGALGTAGMEGLQRAGWVSVSPNSEVRAVRLSSERGRAAVASAGSSSLMRGSIDRYRVGGSPALVALGPVAKPVCTCGGTSRARNPFQPLHAVATRGAKPAKDDCLDVPTMVATEPRVELVSFSPNPLLDPVADGPTSGAPLVNAASTPAGEGLVAPLLAAGSIGGLGAISSLPATESSGAPVSTTTPGSTTPGSTTPGTTTPATTTPGSTTPVADPTPGTSTIPVANVPEPASLALMGLGLLLVVGLRRIPARCAD